MTIDERQDIEDPAAAADMREEFAAAKPDPAVLEAARGQGVRLAEVLQTFVDGYADRPALGQRAREFVTDSAMGRTSARLLPRFETISYRDLWARVSAIAHSITPMIEVLAFEDAPKAYERMMSGHARFRVVLDVAGE